MEHADSTHTTGRRHVTRQRCGETFGVELGVGSIIHDRYRLESILGQGGMGCVYRAEHLGIARTVAIKVLQTEVGGTREATQRFQREALASGRLDHPNIVGVSDFGILDDGSCYLVMEALEGESLGTRLERGALPWREAVEIARSMLRGLVHAHERGVVHRDVKPDNVFLAHKDGVQVVKLLDFGIAKLFAGNDDDPLTTRAGMTMGTPAYLSPEQAVGGMITPASDLYSASVVLFEMLTGRAPFEDPEAIAVMMAHVTRPAPAIEEVSPGVELPPGLSQLVRRGLEKAPDERIGSAAAYLWLLDESVRAIDEAATPRVTPPSMNVVTPAPWLVSGVMPPVEEPGPFGSGAMRSGPDGPSQARHAISIAVATVLPRWISIAGGAAGVVVLLAIVIAVASSGARSRTATTTEPPAIDTRPRALLEPAPAIPEPAPTIDSPGDRDLELKAALHELASGKTCPARKAAIAKLVELGDTRAIPPLKAARHRMRGGLFGIGQSNTNQCLKTTAEAAIKTLNQPP